MRRRRAGAKPKSIPVKPNERIFGLDISSVCVGYAVFDDGALVAHGRFRQQGDSHGEKLVAFNSWLWRMIEQYDPTHIVFEAPFAGRRRFTFGVLMMYCGIVRMVHAAHFGFDVPVDQMVAAHLVKKAWKVKKGTNHEANKRIMLLAVNQQYGLALKFKAQDKTKKVSQDDEADAIALVHAWLCRRGAS